MYELLLLTKSGREITVGTAENDDGAKQLSESAAQLLASLKTATERNDVVVVNAQSSVYWLLPTEIEGMSLFKVEETA